MVTIEGELRQDRWEDKNDHSKKSRVSIVAKNVLLTELPSNIQNTSNRNGGGQGNESNYNDEGFPEDVPF